MRVLLIFLVLLAVAISQGCHFNVKEEDDVDRKKREAPRRRDVLKNLSDYFTACMLQKTRQGVIPVMRSVTDIILRDSKWYEASDEFLCDPRNGMDTVACWNSVIDMLFDWDSVMLGPARECILAYGIDQRPITFRGGFRSKRAYDARTYDSKYFYNDLAYQNCIKSEVNDAANDRTLEDVDWPSIVIFAKEHISRCRLEKYVQHWDGKTAYRRKCDPYRYKGANGEKVDTAQEQFLPSLLDEFVRDKSALKSIIKTCNERYKNGTNILLHPNEDHAAESLSQYDDDDEFAQFGHRGKHDGSDIIGYCSPNSEFTPWYDSSSNGTGDQELLAELKASHPGKICGWPQGIQIRVSRNDEPYHTSGNNFKSLSPNVGLDCQNSMQDQDKKCENFKVRFCCVNTTSGEDNSRTKSSPSWVKTVDTVGTCGTNDNWGPWKNIDSKRGDGGEFEHVSKYRIEYASQYGQNCEAVAVQGRIYFSRRPYTETRNNYKSTDPATGIICLDYMQPKENPCVDLEVRFCCKNGKQRPPQTWNDWKCFILKFKK